MPNPSKSLRVIYDSASEISDPGQRAAFVAEACGTNEALRCQVEELIQADRSAGGFLANSKPRVEIPGATLSEAVGSVIGRYKLLQKIGEGGCGVVYMAEQQEPVRRRVALKIIKLGMDTRSVIARFEAERQALALMNHPNIARVLDAGATETGRPFFVMELVRGINITDYCDQNSLSTEDRLRLLTEVCQAIQHAHQKGIIHRDIKPSNILVTSHDGAPLPKVIDFGVAKATTDQRLTDKTLFTQFEMFIGTPAYMSPEQAEFNATDVDTRTDVYALGVLLYELLTGRTPFDSQTLLKSGIDAMRRTIRETAPVRPSTRLGTLTAAELSEVARRRQSEPPKLISLLRGDLDWIVLKALEKDRTRRYQTANALSSDVQRYLRDEPVSARPPSMLYVLRKMGQRNKATFAAITVVAVALVAGFGVSTTLLVKEKHARERALLAEQTERKSRREAELARQQVDAVNRRLTRELFVREWQEAESLLEVGKIASALTWFARAARNHLEDPAVVNRLVSILSENNFAVPSCRPLGNGAPVTSCVLSADGQKLITSTQDGFVRIWPLSGTAEPLILSKQFHDPLVGFVARNDQVLVADADSISLWGLNGTEVKKHPAKRVGSPQLAMTTDGRFAAINSESDGPHVWDSAELRPIGPTLQDVENKFRVLSLSQDGRYLIGAGDKPGASAWEVSSGRRVWQATPGQETSNGLVDNFVALAELHPDGKSLALNHPQGRVTLWRFEPSTGEENTPKYAKNPILEIRAPSLVSALCFPDSGRRLVLVTSEGFLQLDDFTSGELRPILLEHGGHVTSVRLSLDNRHLATGAADGTARVWDMRMGLPQALVFTNGFSVWDVKFGPDSSWFVMAGADAAEIRDSFNGALRLRLPANDFVTHLDVSRDGRRIVASTEGGTARVWDSRTGALVSPVIRFPHNVQYVEFSPDGRWFIATAPGRIVWVCNADTGTLALSPMTNAAEVVSAHFSPDQRSMVVGTQDGTLEFWTLPEGVQRASSARHKDIIWDVRVSPDGKSLLTASSDRTAALWDLKTGSRLREFRQNLSVFNANVSADGKRVITGGASHEAQVWDAETGHRISEPMRHPGSVWYGEFSRDGRVVVTGDDQGNARLWDTESGLPLGGWLRNGHSLKRVHLSPDMRRVVSAAVSGTVRLSAVVVGPTPAPAWLPALAEAIAGQRLSDDGTIEIVPPDRLQMLSSQLTEQTGDDFYLRWARWFLVERMKKNPAAFER